ncbi:MAG: PEGA domain-containing protein [Verrucomicrobia bacterium]|nr:PEGA domain-containing protein [Verrucomicrobiota bacterium]
MNVCVKVFGSGMVEDAHSRVWGSAGTVVAPFSSWSLARGNVYNLALSGFVEKEGHERVRFHEIHHNKDLDSDFTLPYQGIAEFSNRKAPPRCITVTVQLIPASNAPSAAAKREQPAQLAVSYDRADAIPPRLGTLVVTSDPPGALVYVDDKLVGETPCTLTPFDGFYDVHVVDQERGEYRQTVRVVADTEVCVQASCTPPGQ